jgi:hypothetical protein
MRNLKIFILFTCIDIIDYQESNLKKLNDFICTDLHVLILLIVMKFKKIKKEFIIILHAQIYMY